MPAHRPTEASPFDPDAEWHKCPDCRLWWPHAKPGCKAGELARCPRCWDARGGEATMGEGAQCST